MFYKYIYISYYKQMSVKVKTYVTMFVVYATGSAIYDLLYRWYYWDDPYPHIYAICWEDRFLSKDYIHRTYRNRKYLSRMRGGIIITNPDFWRNHAKHLDNFRKNNLQRWTKDRGEIWRYE